MSANGWLQILLYSLAILAVTKSLVNIQLGEVIFGNVGAEANRRNTREIG